MQHFNVPVESFDDSVFSDGLAFDGSSIRGFQAIHESDMMLLPDVTTAFIDPFRTQKTLALNFFIHDPFTREAYSRDPRNVARKAEDYLASTGIADTAYFGAEAEFYIFDYVRFETKHERLVLPDRLDRGLVEHRPRRAGRQPRLQDRYKGGYFPVPPVDHYADLRDEMVQRMLERRLRRRARATTRSAPPARPRSTTSSTPCCTPADEVMLFKYIVKNTAWAAGKTATFMPKPLFGDNGSGMHAHQSLWNGGEPLFYDETGYGGLSDMARWYIGGLLHHAPSLLAFTNPTVNSYHRLVPGYEAPVNLVYSASATAPPASGSRSPAPTPRPSASSSACPTRRPTRTWPSRRC